MSKVKDLSGQIFDRLTVISRTGSDKRGHSIFKCKCICGAEIETLGNSLLTGRTCSCGCKNRDKLRELSTKHGKAYTSTYQTWINIKDRCLNEKNKAFKYYGGRGISVCESWLQSFENFLKDMGDKPEGLTIERLDVNGNYEPSNCKWATWDEQRKNKRSH